MSISIYIFEGIEDIVQREDIVRRYSSKRMGKLWNSHFTEWEREFTRNKDCCSVTQLCLILCNPMDYNAPGFPALHYLPEFAQIHVHRVSDAIQPSHPLSPPLLLLSIFPSIKVFSSELALPSGGQSIGASASASVLRMNIQGWFPLGLSGLLLLSKGFSEVISNTTVQKQQFFGTQPSSWSNSHICTWLLEKP